MTPEVIFLNFILWKDDDDDGEEGDGEERDEDVDDAGAGDSGDTYHGDINFELTVVFLLTNQPC
jgi:hypothetical protein